MEHDKAKNILQEYLDGDLSAKESKALRMHLDECESCASDYERLEGLIQSAHMMPLEIDPARDLWKGIEKRMASGDEDQPAEASTVRRPIWNRPMAMVAIAAALVLTILATNRMLGNSEGFAGLSLGGAPASALDLLASGTVDALEAETAAADPGVQALLSSDANKDREETPPMLENLQIVNKAIDDARRAWKANPENSHLARMLISAYQAKIALQEKIGQIAERT